MPWDEISQFVNTLRKYVIIGSRSESTADVLLDDNLHEDFVLRGSTLAQNDFPLHFIDDLIPSIKRMEERPEYVVYRAKRIWHLAYKSA